MHLLEISALDQTRTSVSILSQRRLQINSVVSLALEQGPQPRQTIIIIPSIHLDHLNYLKLPQTLNGTQSVDLLVLETIQQIHTLIETRNTSRFVIYDLPTLISLNADKNNNSTVRDLNRLFCLIRNLEIDVVTTCTQQNIGILWNSCVFKLGAYIYHESDMQVEIEILRPQSVLMLTEWPI